MAEESKSAVNAEEALPMQKPSSTAKIAGAVGGAVILGLVIFAATGGEDSSGKVEETEKAADAQQGMSKAEIAERQAHLKKTQAALAAVAADEAEEDQKEKAEQQKKQAASSPAPAPRPSSGSPAPAKKPANSKKSMDGLDALGADITDALK